MKRFILWIIILALLVSALPVQAQAPAGYTMPWQTVGTDKDVLIWQIAVVAIYLGYPATWPAQSIDNGRQLLIWIDTQGDDLVTARNRILCGLSWAFPGWRSSRSACQVVA